MGNPAPALAGIQHVLLGYMSARAGDVRHVAAGDQQRVRTEADPPVGAHVPGSSRSPDQIACTAGTDQQVTFLAPLRTHLPRPDTRAGLTKPARPERANSGKGLVSCDFTFGTTAVPGPVRSGPGPLSRDLRQQIRIAAAPLARSLTR